MARAMCAAAQAVRARVRSGCSRTHAPRSTTDSVRSWAATPRAADNFTRVVVRDLKCAKNAVDRLTMPDFLPRRESELSHWARNFVQLISASPEDYGVSVEAADALAAAHAAFATQYVLAMEPQTRTSPVVVAKNDAMAAMIVQVREVAALVRVTCSKTPEKLVQLGLRVKEGRGPRIAVPGDAPLLKIKSVQGRRVTITLRDANASHRRKPDSVVGSSVYCFVGDEPPVLVDEWTCRGHFTVNTIELGFPETLAPGTKVWFTACWLSPRLKQGPGSAPQYAWLSGGLMEMRNVVNRAA